MSTGEASTYSTGGGGVVLEHRYGATLLAYLLTGDPLPMLGDDATVASVRFQASRDSPVDDLVVTGHSPDGCARRLSIGVRRAPVFVASNAASRRLLASYGRLVELQWDEVRDGRWQLGLAVAVPDKDVRQLETLATIARGRDEAALRAEVDRPRATNQGARDRLVHLDDLLGDRTLTWQMLSGLQVHAMRLEGVDETDRTPPGDRS